MSSDEDKELEVICADVADMKLAIPHLRAAAECLARMDARHRDFAPSLKPVCKHINDIADKFEVGVAVGTLILADESDLRALHDAMVGNVPPDIAERARRIAFGKEN